VNNDPTRFLTIEPELTPEIYDEIEREDAGRSDLFRQFIDERVSYEEEEKLAEWSELLHDFYDVAPYDHLVLRGMKPEHIYALKELTLDDVGFENREVFPAERKDARSLMRYISAHPKQPRDHDEE
jgi:hypothetical protein